MRSYLALVSGVAAIAGIAATGGIAWAQAVKPLVLRVLLIIATLVFLTPNISARAGDLPNTPPDGWWWYYGQTPEQVGSLLKANNARLTNIQVEQASPVHFTVAMVQNTGAYAKTWWWYYGQTETDIANHAKELNARIVNLDAYELNGKTYFAAIFISNTGSDARSWWWYFGQTPAQIGTLLEQHKARLIDFRQYPANGGTQYVAVMVENTGADATAWWWYYNISATQVSSELQKNSAYLVSLQVADAKSPTFNVIMNKLPTPGGRGWWWYYGVNALELTGLYDLNAAWLRDVKTYEIKGQRVFTALMLGAKSPSPEAVTTYHYDNNRTGWNSNESILKPTNVTPNGFGLMATADLDDDNDQVDAQPLIVPNQTIQGIGVRTVAYVVTENNSVYGIDAFSGAKLVKVNLGAPVPRPLNCENGGPAVGINGTPTIDIDTRTLYVVSYVMVGSAPAHQLHALDLATLQDKPGSPVTIAASTTLQDGSADKFDSSVQRQRAALLQANGNVYAGFGSYCDFKAAHSRGWVLGWRQSSLTPLGHNELLNKAVTAPSSFNCYFHAPWTDNHPCFLSSVWMSGFGLASDAKGDLFFTTGNTAEGIYNSTTNLAESLVKLSPDLSTVVDFFTPADVNTLDANDNDFGSGGALVLPDQPGPVPHVAVAAGKDGNLFIVNRDTGHMGGFHNPDVSASVQINDCWCGPSYFKGADGMGRIVSSGGSQIKQWTVNTANTPALALEASAPPLEQSGQDGGFFTSASSEGTAAKTGIIWAVDRPVGNDNVVTLYAFDATASGGALKQLWSGEGGTWPNTGGNANIVPTVANGRVYVGSYKQLRIFGLTSSKLTPKRMFPQTRFELAQFTPTTGPLYWGTIRKVDGSRVTLELRSGRLLTVDVSKVLPQATSDFGAIGRALAVSGIVGPDGVLVASGIWRAKGPSLWGPDRDG